MDKHTPGPWTINGSAIESDLPDGTEVVAFVESDNDAPPTGDWRANARLIAKAPEMLDLLMRCLGALEGFDPTCADVKDIRSILKDLEG